MNLHRLNPILIFFSLALAFDAQTQARSEPAVPISFMDETPELTTIGIGVGQIFGGMGLNATYYATPQFGMFLGAGYAMAGMGVNAGAKIRFLPEDLNARPYLLGMYGYNAAVAVADKPTLNKLFYGATFGGGIDLYHPDKQGYWTLALLIPLRSAEVDEYIQMLEDDHGVIFQSRLIPVTFSLGYSFMLE